MGCPKGWLDYEPIGKVVPNTRIVAFKTPLKPELYRESSRDPTQDRYHYCCVSVSLLLCTVCVPLRFYYYTQRTNVLHI